MQEMLLETPQILESDQPELTREPESRKVQTWRHIAMGAILVAALNVSMFGICEVPWHVQAASSQSADSQQSYAADDADKTSPFDDSAVRAERVKNPLAQVVHLTPIIVPEAPDPNDFPVQTIPAAQTNEFNYNGAQNTVLKPIVWNADGTK